VHRLAADIGIDDAQGRLDHRSAIIDLCDEADETGIIVAGIDANNHGYVLADQSGRYPPTEWARIAIRVYRQYNANRIAVYPVALNFEQAVQARITTLADRHAPCPNAVPH
jgi:phage terminase large subunit-like protein